MINNGVTAAGSIVETIETQDVLDQLSSDEQQVNDIKAPLSDFEPVVDDNDNFAIRYNPTGETFKPTKHALTNMSLSGMLSSGFAKAMVEPKVKNDKIVFERNVQDAEVLVHAFKSHLWNPNRVDQDKQRLWRMWSDGTLRAMLSKDYTIINNRWLLDAVNKIAPQARIVHAFGNVDTFYCNFVIPDDIKRDDNSDYGYGFGIHNSEIGERRIGVSTYLFRSICSNGCIFGKENQSSFSRVHRRKDGIIDLSSLNDQLTNNIQLILKEAGSYHDKLMATKDLKTDVSMVKVIAQLTNTYNLNRKNAFGVLEKFYDEKKLIDTSANSLFGIHSAITRFAQTLESNQRFDIENMSSNIMSISDKQWVRICNAAQNINEDEYEKYFVAV